MRNTTFVAIDLTRSTFEDATIIAPKFRTGALKFQALRRAKSLSLENSSFHWVDIKDLMELYGLRCQNADLRGDYQVRLSGAQVNSASLGPWVTFDELKKSHSFRIGDLSGIQLYQCDFSNADLSGIRLTNAYFHDCNFSDCDLSHSVISGAGFSEGTIGLTDKQLATTWNGRHDRMSSVRLPKKKR